MTINFELKMCLELEIFLDHVFNSVDFFFRSSMAKGATSDERANSLENVTKTIGNLLDGYDIRLRPNFGGTFAIHIL